MPGMGSQHEDHIACALVWTFRKIMSYVLGECILQCPLSKHNQGGEALVSGAGRIPWCLRRFPVG